MPGIPLKLLRSFGNFGEWCNGSTTDSDSVCLGSNPSSPASADQPVGWFADRLPTGKYPHQEPPMPKPIKPARGDKRIGKAAAAGKRADAPLLGEAALKEALAGFGVLPNGPGAGAAHGASAANGGHAAATKQAAPAGK